MATIATISPSRCFGSLGLATRNICCNSFRHSYPEKFVIRLSPKCCYPKRCAAGARSKMQRHRRRYHMFTTYSCMKSAKRRRRVPKAQADAAQLFAHIILRKSWGSSRSSWRALFFASLMLRSLMRRSTFARASSITVSLKSNSFLSSK